MSIPSDAGEAFDLRLGTGPHVQGFLHRGSQGGDAVVLAHGAGTDCHAAILVAVASRFAAVGVTALRINLPFRQERPQGPPSSRDGDRDREGLRRAVAALRQRRAARVLVGGHSYGGRQASMLVGEDHAVAEGALLLSYPLHPPRREADLRTRHFPSIRTPSLFVHGTRDPFGTTDEIATAIAAIPARTQLVAIDGGTHDLLAGRTSVALDVARIAEIIVTATVAFHLGGDRSTAAAARRSEAP